MQQHEWTLEIIILSEVSQKEKDRDQYDITYMFNLKYNTNEHTMKQKQTQGHREQTCGGHGKGGWRGNSWEFGISRCKQVYIGWINNKILFYG